MRFLLCFLASTAVVKTGFKRVVGRLAFLTMLFGAVGQANAIPLTPPIKTDVFKSRADLSITVLPTWTGLPDPITFDLTLCGGLTIPGICTGGTVTTIDREVNATGNPDTVNTEMVSMELVGNSPAGPVTVRVGANNGVVPSLIPSGGQIRENPASPNNGRIDFLDPVADIGPLLNPILPGDSFFDVFFDLWIDLDNDGIPDLGEVLRSSLGLEQTALRLFNIDELLSLPPQAGAQYGTVINNVVVGGVIVESDPCLYLFCGVPGPGPLELRVVDAAGTLGAVHALLDPADSHTHTVPVPSTFALFAVGIGLLLGRWKKEN